MIKNKIVSIAREWADPIAKEYFLNICGFNRDREKHKKLIDIGMTIKEKIQDIAQIRAIVSSFGHNVISDNCVKLDGVKIECNAFEQLNTASIKEIFIYILTIGKYGLDEQDSIMDQLYTDIWGTAYVDAGRVILRKIILDKYCEDHDLRGQNIFISDSFGPGYYGMDVKQVKNFFEVLDYKKIGVELKSSSLIMPLKSCVGFYIITDDETLLPGEECKNCFGNNGGCRFCHLITQN